MTIEPPRATIATTRWAFGTWLALLGWLTLRPDPAAAFAAAGSPWWCVACGQAGGADLLLNVVLFLPLGLLAARSGRAWSFAVGVGLGLSLAIEATQGILIPGRDAALGDVLANTTGGALGWLLVTCRDRAVGRRFLILAAPASLVVLALVLYGSARLLAPDLTGPGPLRLIQPPSFTGRPRYPGRVHRLELQEAGAAGARVRAEFAWAPPDTAALTPILRLDDAAGWPVVAIDRRAERVAIEVRTRAAGWRLRLPTWSVLVPRGIPAGAPISLELRIAPGAVRLAAFGGSDSAALIRRYGAQHGWLLLNPFAPTGSGDAWKWWTLLWLAGWGVVCGLGAATRRRRLAWGLAAVGIVVVGTGVAGAPATPPELVAFGLGWLVAISSARFRHSPGGA